MAEWVTDMKLLSSACVVCSAVSLGAFANIPSDVVVDPGSVANLTVAVTVSGDLGDETSTDSKIVSSGGGGAIAFSPDQEPFTSVGLNQLQFLLGNASLNFEFFCQTIFGCQDLTITLTDLSITLATPTGGSFTETGRAEFYSPWRLQANYVLTSDLVDSSGVIDTTTDVGFGATFNAAGGVVFIHELALGQISGDLPNDLGLVVTFQASADLGGTTMSGFYEPWEPEPPKACGDGGPCGDVHGPGCDDVDCCVAVCEWDYACCEFGWSPACAVYAVEMCGATPGNDNCESAYDIGLERVPFTTINSNTDGQPLITECATAPSGQNFVHDVWFRHVPQASNGVLVSTCGHAGFDTRLAVYTQCDGQLLACNDDADGCSGGSSRVAFFAEQGETYLIRVGGASGWGSGEIDVAWGDVNGYPTSIAVKWAESEGGNGHWYAMYSLGSNANFADASAAATQFGGMLATITSPEEQAFINASMPATLVGGNTAIGLIQDPDGAEPGGGWQWVTGEPLDWTNWRVGEPNDAGGEDYGMMFPDGTWNDGPNVFGHVLIEFDEDPELDTVTWDVNAGGNGHSYESVIVPQLVSWEQAKIYAENRGGQLVSLETEDEANWVFEHLTAFTSLWSMTAYNGGPWVGMFRNADGWWWLSETAFDWDGWVPGEPNGTGDRACWYGSSRFYDTCADCPFVSGDLYGSAELVDVFGQQRLKLVADSFAGSWGTWIADPIAESVVAFEASFRFSFKNENGGPGDGFSFLWGDLSDTSGSRVEGGEWGVNAFIADGQGLAVGVQPYPAAGTNGVKGLWGASEFAFAGVDFSSITYSDYETAVDPVNMATMTITWSIESGVAVAVAFPWNDPVVIWSDQGTSLLPDAAVDQWQFGFAARNGAIDMDVLLGDITIGYEFTPDGDQHNGGPRNTFDDTYDENLRRALIIEYADDNSCPADLNGNGTVDVDDLLAVIAEFGADCTLGGNCDADIDQDLDVDVDDLLIVISAFGPCSG